jgi:plastocyanin
MRARLTLAGLLFCVFAAGDQTVTVGPATSFSPANVSVAPGEKVTWVWVGVFHSSTSEATAGPEVWDSGIISTGSFSHVFTAPGTYPYYCSLHSFPGGTLMNGVVEVIVPPTATATPTATSTPTASPTLTPTVAPTLAPTVSPATPPPGAAVPALGLAGKLALALGLLALSLSLLWRKS